MKTFEQFNDDDIKKMMEENMKKDSLKVGDIVDIDFSHTSKDSRIFAKVTSVFKPAGLAAVESIICHRRPYLCDNKFPLHIDAFDLSILANMELFKEKMKGPNKINNNDDPWNEEIWDDDYVEDFDNI